MFLYVILGFRHVLLGYYTTSGGNFLPTFRDNLSVQSSRVKNPNQSQYGLYAHYGPATRFLFPSAVQRQHSLLDVSLAGPPGQFSSPFSLRLHLFSPSLHFTSACFPFASPLPSFLPSFIFFHSLPVPSPASYSPFPLLPADSHKSLVRPSSTSQAPLLSSPPSSLLFGTLIVHSSSPLNSNIPSITYC